MSKRSYRRLAAAAGAAIALGTAIPAMAIGVSAGAGAGGGAAVEVVPPSLLPQNLNVFQTLAYAEGEAFDLHDYAMNDAHNLNDMMKGDLVAVLGAVNIGGLFDSQGNSCSGLVFVASCNNGPGGNINVLNGDGPLANVTTMVTSTIQNVGIGSFGVGNIVTSITNNLSLTSSLLANL